MTLKIYFGRIRSGWINTNTGARPMEFLPANDKLRRCASRISDLMHTDSVAILFFSDDKLSLRLLREFCCGPGFDHDMVLPIEGLAVHALSLDKPGAAIGDRPVSDFERQLSAGHNFTCCVLYHLITDGENPLRHGEPIGVVYLFGKHHEASFNEEDLRILKMFADQASDLLTRYLETPTVIKALKKMWEEIKEKERQVKELNNEITELRQQISQILAEQ